MWRHLKELSHGSPCSEEKSILWKHLKQAMHGSHCAGLHQGCLDHYSEGSPTPSSAPSCAGEGLTLFSLRKHHLEKACDGLPVLDLLLKSKSNFWHSLTSFFDPSSHLLLPSGMLVQVHTTVGPLKGMLHCRKRLSSLTPVVDLLIQQDLSKRKFGQYRTRTLANTIRTFLSLQLAYCFHIHLEILVRRQHRRTSCVATDIVLALLVQYLTRHPRTSFVARCAVLAWGLEEICPLAPCPRFAPSRNAGIEKAKHLAD